MFRKLRMHLNAIRSNKRGLQLIAAYCAKSRYDS